MQLSFRAKLIAIVGTTAMAFLVLIVTSAITATRVEQQLTTIQERYVPKIELGPQLESQFERLRRNFQDAVGARDAEMLSATRDLKDGFLGRLAAAHDTVDPTDATALRMATEEYYAAAYDLSHRIIEGETGEEIVDAMTQMQGKQTRASELLKKATAFDKGELTEAFSAAARAQITAGRLRFSVSVACLVLATLLSIWLSRGVLSSLAALTAGFTRFGKGDFEEPILTGNRDELEEVAKQANRMAKSLKDLAAERDRADWLRNGHAGLAQELRGELEPKDVASRIARFLARYLEAPVAALYYADDDHTLQLLGHVAFPSSNTSEEPAAKFRVGEGLVGQAALAEEITVIRNIPANYLRVRSGLGEGTPSAIVLLPLVHLGSIRGVLELALFKPWTELSSDLLISVRETLAIALEVARARSAMHALLAETQHQARRLATQEEELRTTNEELQTQQEELRQTNEELSEQAKKLDAQRRTLQDRNAQLDDARRHLEKKADELATVSTYKSQFLANMSHELRTPLNSMLLLSNLLIENQTKNLTDKQVEYARTIYFAGKDLLALINQVLDLAKVEAGKQQVSIESISLGQLAEHAERVFSPLAADKNIRFLVETSPEAPKTITTDGQRVQQILTNLLANAIKFTQQGEVTLRIERPAPDCEFRRDDLKADRCVAFAVTDTGVGIAPQHQERIFAPFEQVEAASDRRYGGTGLGLTITRELTTLLGGELQLRSVLGTGSTFTCYLPIQQSVGSRPSKASPVLDGGPSAGPAIKPLLMANAAGKETEALSPGEAHLLIIEDDRVFAETFADLISDQGLKYALATDGQTGLRWAKERKPNGIILDVKLPDTDGWKIMEALQADPETKSIPVHFVSAVDGGERGLAMGAVGYLTKPATSRDLARVIESLAPRLSERRDRILVIESDGTTGEMLAQRLAAENLKVQRVPNAHEALATLKKDRFGCMILDLSLPDMDGLDFLRSLQEQCGTDTPSVIVYTARALKKAEVEKLEAYTEAIVLKEGSSVERLLDEIRLFTRRLKDDLGSKQQMTPRTHPADIRLKGRKILVADDDMRTAYALSATLRSKGVEVLVADTGRAALDVLAERPDIEAVLMDIMMPEMDGYEAIRRMRQDARFRKLPIIALSAKAMKGDKEKCLEVGASDYLPKPVDLDRLIALVHSHLSTNGRDE